MSNLNILKMSEKEILASEVTPGNVYISTNIIRKVFVDYDDFVRQEITNNCRFFANYDAIMKMPESMVSTVLYFDVENSTFYGDVQGNFKDITSVEEIENIINNIDAYKEVILTDKGEIATPVSTQQQILTEEGVTYDEAVDPEKFLTVVRVHFAYMHIRSDETRVLRIPYPKENYDFANGDLLVVMKNNVEFDSKRYVVNGNYLRLNDDEFGFQEGELITMIFYYKVNYDLNSLVVLGTQNIADGSITTEKLSPYLEFSADYITETGDRIFFSQKEREKLANIEEFATHYVHPSTHPAEMIEESEERMFIPKSTLQKLLTSDNGYSKEQIDEMFETIVGGAPELLDTLGELAKAMNDDANFASNITKMINERATKEELNALTEVVNTKVSVTDYVRGCIYASTTKSNITGVGELYSLKHDDPKLLDYIDGMKVVIKITDDNSGPAFLKINSLERKPILTQDGLTLLESDLKAGSIYELRYSGSTNSFILQGKGGATILDTTYNEYQLAAEENIRKGQLLDKLPDDTVCALQPHLKVVSYMESTLPSLYCDGQVEVLDIDENSVLVAWKMGKSIRLQVFNLSGDYINYVENNATYSFDYTEISSDCYNKFAITKVEDDFIIAYQEGELENALYNIKHIKIGSESSIIIQDDSYITSETQNLGNLYLETFGKKVIATYGVGNDLKVIYINMYSGSMVIINSRLCTSFNYNKRCRVSDSQVVFAQITNSSIKTFVLIVTPSDFFLTDTDNILYTNVDNKKLANLSMVCTADNEIFISWTDTSTANYYYGYAQVSENGMVTLDDITNTEMTSENFKSYNNLIQKRLNDKFTLSVSNWNHLIPSSNDYPGNQCFKIVISKKGNPLKVVDKFEKMYTTAKDYSFTIIDNNRLVVVYSANKTNDVTSRLNFIICDIIKMPFGLALESGVGGELIQVKEW